MQVTQEVHGGDDTAFYGKELGGLRFLGYGRTGISYAPNGSYFYRINQVTPSSSTNYGGFQLRTPKLFFRVL